VRALVADLDGRDHGYDLRPSETERGLEDVLQRMAGSLEAAASQAGVAVSDLGGVGIASPGAIDVGRGIVAGAPQLPGWRDVPLVQVMSERLGVPVVLENDASAAALSEHRYGAGKAHGTLILVTRGLAASSSTGGYTVRAARAAGHAIST
jgi:glucokinase